MTTANLEHPRTIEAVCTEIRALMVKHNVTQANRLQIPGTLWNVEVAIRLFPSRKWDAVYSLIDPDGTQHACPYHYNTNAGMFALWAFEMITRAAGQETVLVYIGREDDPEERIQFNITQMEWRALAPKGNRRVHTIHDVATGEAYRVRWVSCGLSNCRCALGFAK